MGHSGLRGDAVTEGNVDCPKCAKALEQLELEGIEVDKCPGCNGVWLDEYELEDLLELTPEALSELLLAGTEDMALDEHAARCPRDGEELRRLRQRGVIVDCCPECQGLWLDGGEFRRLRA